MSRRFDAGLIKAEKLYELIKCIVEGSIEDLESQQGDTRDADGNPPFTKEINSLQEILQFAKGIMEADEG